MKGRSIRFTAALLALILLTTTTWGQTTAFNYQGRLTDMGNPPTATYQMEFKLFDAVTGGAQIGATVTDSSVAVNQGVFTTQLDFGVSAFPGADRFLEIAVRRNAGESYVLLTPRQQIASSPYSIRTVSAQQADVALDSQKLGGVLANQFVQTSDSRLSDARNPLPGSTSYIQNTTTQQTSTNFNIGGNGFIGGNVGIGTTNPVTKLDVRGNLTLEAGGNPGLFTAASGGEQNRYLSLVNSPTTPTASGLKSGGILVSDDYFFANPAKNDLIVKGNVGIGTNTPLSKLAVAAAGYGFTQTSGSVTVGSYVNTSGGWYGTKSNHALFFFTHDSSPKMTVDTSGNVGIGDTGPLTRLALSGGPTWTSNGWIGSLSLQNASAIGWEANASGQRFGIGQSGGGLYFFRTNSAFGTTTSPANYDMSITDSGNITQARDKGGMIKAMIRVLANGSIAACYNGVTGATTGNCGFTITHFSTGNYAINFGFQVNDRFAILQGFNTPSIYYNTLSGPNIGSVLIQNISLQNADDEFNIIVY